VYGDHTIISNALEELRKGFVSGVPARLKKIEHSIAKILASDSADTIEETIHSLIIAFHSLAGTGSTYGYYDIGRHAKAAEHHLKKLSPRQDDIQQAMAKLNAYVQAIHIDLEELDSEQYSDQKLKQLTTHLEMNHRRENLLIYLADEDGSYAEELHTLLISSGFKVEYFTTLYELEERIRYQRPDTLILNCEFSGDEFAGFDFMTGVQESLEDRIPTIFISEHNSIEQKYRASSVMGCYFLNKPITVTGLLYAIELVMNRNFAEPYKVLVVDEDVAHSEYVSHLLQQSGINTRVENDARKVLSAINEYHPEVVLLDIYMSGYNGIELASMIRLDPVQQFTSILFVTTDYDSNQQLEAIALGGDDFLAKPIDPRILIRTVEARAERTRSHNRSYTELRHTVNVLEQFKIALDQHAIVSAADRDGKIIYANPRFCEISGYRPDELIGRNHNILNSGFHDRQFFSNMWQTIAAGKTWKGEIKNRSKYGDEYWVESTITPLLDESGKPYQYISIRTDITRQKQATEELAISEERLRRSQSYANIGTWDWNIRTGELHWSDQIGPLFGYEAMVDTTYDNFINAVHPDDRQLVMDSVNNCVEKGASYDIEHRIVRANGEVRWLSEKGDVVRDVEGKPQHMLGVVQDITSRKQSEKQLQQSQQRLIQAQTQAQLGNWEANLLTGELYWSDVIYTIFGHDPNNFEPSVQAFHEAVHPDDRETVRASELEAKQTGIHDVIHRIVRPNGEIRYVHELAKQIYDEAGQAIHLIGTVQDITELKLAETQLYASEAKLKGMFDLSPLGIALTDMNGNYIEFNKAFQDICGYSEEELLQLDYWTLTPRKYEEPETEQIRLLKATGRYGPYEKEYRKKNGTLIPIRLNGMLVHDPSGETYIWSIVEDITDRKKAEKNLIAAKEEAESANRAKSDFLSRMSHELRTPMNAILGFAQLMESDDSDPLSENHQSSNEQILRAGWHLLELINEVLDLSKIESGMLDVSMESIDAAEVIQECIELVKSQTEQYKVEIVNNITGPLHVLTDRTRFKQIYLNLLTNAIKYNRRDGSVILDVERDPTRSRFKFIVQDTGNGISNEQLEHLFEPFNRLGAEDSAIEGTGIGLVIARRLVELMGGDISVQSTPNVGSKFCFTMKCAEADQTDIYSMDILDEEDDHRDSDSDVFTILYVEDNPANLKLVGQILKRIGDIGLHSASTGIEGLNVARQINADLILLDINLPDINGMELAHAIRSDEHIRQVPIIAISANAMTNDINTALSNGFDDYLTKPIDVNSFSKTIEKFKRVKT